MSDACTPHLEQRRSRRSLVVTTEPGWGDENVEFTVWIVVPIHDIFVVPRQNLWCDLPLIAPV